MESQLLNNGLGTTYQSLARNKSEILNINYLNEHHNEMVVPLKEVVKILKDIELRLEDAVNGLTSACDFDGDIGTARETLDEIYQEI